MANCSKLKEEQIQISKSNWDKTIADVVIYIKDQVDKGLNPEQFNPGPGKPLVNLLKLAEDYKNERDNQAIEISKQVDEQCSEDVVEITQLLVDLAIVKFTKGISLILPQHVTHIDVKEIFNGKPFGGDNSIVNQARGALMRGIGIDENSSLGKVILDPTGTVKDTWDKDNGDIGNFIKGLF
jgi:hypothetical protein